jgi:aspartyl protease family protein
MGTNGPYIVFYVVAAVFVASSLIGRRTPLSTTLKMTLAWIGIFAVAFALFAFRNDFAWVGKRLWAEATGNPIVEGSTVKIPISEDGHYWVQASLNGQNVRFMVDSGASITTIDEDTAASAGVAAEGRRVMVNTANGAAWMTQATADRLEVGTIVRSDFPVDISSQEDMNLLGMNFLSTLRGWRVEGNTLVLQP